jgi:hypothetical protein
MKYAVTIIVDSVDGQTAGLHQAFSNGQIDLPGLIENVYVSPIVDIPQPEYIAPAAGADLIVSYPPTPRPLEGEWTWDILNKAWVSVE